MEGQIYKCIIIGLVFLLIAFIFYLLKKLVVVTILIILGAMFFARGGIAYMASNFEPPKIEMPFDIKEIEEPALELEIPEVELQLEMPRFRYKDSGEPGFGLDFLNENE